MNASKPIKWLKKNAQVLKENKSDSKREFQSSNSKYKSQNFSKFRRDQKKKKTYLYMFLATYLNNV